MTLAAWTCAALLLAQQDPEALFALSQPTGGDAPVTAAADRRAVNCLDALQELAVAAGWNLRIESKPLENDLRFATVDFAFSGQDPRIIGQLIAVAAGADVVFDDGDAQEGLRPTMHVVRRPDAATESGRLRLRTVAGQWYRSFLQDDLRYDPLVHDEAMRVRMNLGSLLVENGDLEAALPFFGEVYEDRPGPHAPAAVLRLAQTCNEIGARSRDRETARRRHEQAEAWSRKLLELYPSLPEATGATVELGRALLGLAAAADDEATARELCDKCRVELAARVMRLDDSAEMLEVWLLVGEAQFRLEWPGRVYETMLTLREARNFSDLSDRQLRDYHFLLGYGAMGVRKPELAMQALEWMLIRGDADSRRGLAHVLLADAYLQQGRYVQARAAAQAARRQHMSELPPQWRTEALRLYAKTGLALGDKEAAFQELEVLVHREDDPDLTLFLIDELLADRQWQRAISIARLLNGRAGAHGDQARFKTVRAMHEQARASSTLAEFVAQAREIAPRIESRELRSQCAELIGDAFTALGQLEAAADAYRGILR